MNINNYVPFLKLKKNELSAVVKLMKEDTTLCTPFFDIPKPKNDSEKELKAKVNLTVRQMKEAQDKAYFPFVLDIYDLDEDALVEQMHLYDYVLEAFSCFDCYPVIGLDRSEAHNKAVIDRVDSFDAIFVRVDYDDFNNPRILVDELEDLVAELPDSVALILVIDFRVQIDPDFLESSPVLEDFYNLLGTKRVSFTRSIITSSSIPKSMSELIKSHSEIRKARSEWAIWEKYNGLDVIYGDYGVVSPDYSDANIAPEIMFDVQTPKIIYTSEDILYAVRGGGMRRYGTDQFFKLAENVTNLDFFRAGYSEAEKYVESVANRTNLVYRARQGRVPACGSASKWIEVTTLAHINYMGRLLA